MRVHRLVFGCIVIAACLLSSACATTSDFSKQLRPQSRLIATPEQPPHAIGAKGTADDLDVVVEAVVIPDGPGSWVKDADWDEYTLRFRSTGKVPLTIRSVDIVDVRGLHVSPGSSTAELREKAKLLAGTYESFGLLVSKNLGMQALIAGSYTAVGAAGAGLLGAGVVAAAAPLAAVAAPAYVAWRLHARRVDEKRLEAEFARRHVSLPLVLDPGAEVRVSFFYPPAASPKAVTVAYVSGGLERHVRVDVTRELQGLHVVSSQPAH